MIRPVLFGLFLGQKPSRTWRKYLVLFPLYGFVSRGGRRGGIASLGAIVPGLWWSRVSSAAGDRIWTRVERSKR